MYKNITLPLSHKCTAGKVNRVISLWSMFLGCLLLHISFSLSFLKIIYFLVEINKFIEYWWNTNNSFKTIALQIFFKNLTIQQMFNILWNHLYSWGPVFVDSGFYAYWSRCKFVDALVFRFSKKHNSLWICFSQRCKLMEEGYQ